MAGVLVVYHIGNIAYAICVTALFVATIIVLKKIVSKALQEAKVLESWSKTIQGCIMIVVQFIVYYNLMSVLVHPLASSWRVGFNFILGVILATCSIILMLSTIHFFRGFEYSKYSKSKSIVVKKLIVISVFFLVLAVFEEIVFRGIFFSVIRRMYSPIHAITISTLFFVILHIKNEGMNIRSLTSVMLGGLLLCVLRELSGSILLPLGFHFAWNTLQGILGFNVSGDMEVEAIFVAKKVGRYWVTGGDFGPEASIITLIILVGLNILVMTYGWTNNLLNI